MLKTLFSFFFIILSLKNFSQVQDSILIGTNEAESDSLNVNTSFLVTDSSKYIGLGKTKIIFQKPFSQQSCFITKDNILRNDYRYTGDLLKHFPFSFERSYGLIGQPNDIYLYGEGSNSTAFLIDGVPIVSSLFYSVDFNHLQSEDIDSIEIVPLPRGFVYGFNTNPVSVNFISKDIIPTQPYSRIKYYEGPFGEAFIDGIFSMNLFKDLISSVEITNRKVDDSYKNSAFSIWQAKAKLRYNLSDEINIIGNYYFSKSNTGINGGVNVDEIKQTTDDITSILYNEISAPVYYENNSLDFKQHQFGLKVLATPFENAFTDLNFYYKFSLEEYHQHFTGYRSKSARKDKIYGLTLDQRFNVENFYLHILTGYQIIKDIPSFYSSNPLDPTYFLTAPIKETNSFYLSPLVKMPLFENSLIASIYGKIAKLTVLNTFSENKTNESLGGFGADIIFNITDQLNLYSGYSKFDEITNRTNVNLFEVKLCYHSENFGADLRAFNKKIKSTSTSALSLKGYYKYWKILFEGSLSQYFYYNNGDTYEYFNLPESNASLGVFIQDTFFNSNLDLKAGLKTHYIGKQNLQFLIIPYKGYVNADVPSSFTIDFTLSGVIQKSAIVYFTWENLLNKKFYVTPYYPMLQRNIRFGVAWEIFN